VLSNAPQWRIDIALPFDAAASEYRRQAETLLVDLRAHDTAAEWQVKWQHPRFRGKRVDDVRAAALTLDDAQAVVAREHHFDDWAALMRFADTDARQEPVARFERVVDAIVSGERATVSNALSRWPALVHARSVRRHHATLLHYVAANGVENYRQRTPSNALDITRTLLDAGAVVDALADMYDNKCTTLSMLVSSGPPHAAGLQAPLAELLVAYGAALEGPGTNWTSAVQTALAFGYLETARALVRRGGRVDDVVTAAGLGDERRVRALIEDATPLQRQAALAVAAQHGHSLVVAFLIDAGEDPGRCNPDGFHSHSTPLHQAVWANHLDTVRVLVERGAPLDVRDTVYDGTPLDWAEYGKREEIARYLRAAAAR
jgi:ankyrin repeat protein